MFIQTNETKCLSQFFYLFISLYTIVENNSCNIIVFLSKKEIFIVKGFSKFH